MNLDLIMIYGVFVYILVTGLLLFWIKKDLYLKIYTYLKAPQGAKLFTIYRKDNTKETFAACAKSGGMIKHDGDDYQITRKAVVIDRNKNCPEVTLVEGEVRAIDPYQTVSPRIDTKSLRALFWMEREKARDDINPDVKLLKLLVIICVVGVAISAIIAYFTYQNTTGLMHAVPAAATAASVVL